MRYRTTDAAKSGCQLARYTARSAAIARFDRPSATHGRSHGDRDARIDLTTILAAALARFSCRDLSDQLVFPRACRTVAAVIF